MRVGRAVAAVGGAVGLAAAAAALTMRRKADDPYADEPFGELPADRVSTIAADDGVALSVEEIDPADGGAPDLTAILVHGFALSRLCWHFQRRDLARLTGPRVAQILYDHRSHGRSQRTDAAGSTIEQLARDLEAVIRVAAPEGPLVLIGHSMGGMVVIALAELFPELFAARVRGVALIGTSAGEVGKQGLPRPLLSKYNPLTRLLGRFADWQPGLVELIRAAGGQLTRAGVRTIGFGSREVSPRLVDFMVAMLDVTPVRVLADFVDTLGSHNRYAALAGLRECRVLVLGGDEDWMTPWSHAERIAEELPHSTLVRVRGAGHLVMLERPDVVTGHLAVLLRDCAGIPSSE
ncbi:acetoin dehydrogenase E2 subunit dihydrolipoyllysine-residue acetyltransferase [Actinokineospora sp. UTMC 2448]|nr:acetoin dehydrogenase E2 subunit dihydrolipoyllysine-residue acetyltransferase [Actinokineospora sp. UTMC 2448]